MENILANTISKLDMACSVLFCAQEANAGPHDCDVEVGNAMDLVLQSLKNLQLDINEHLNKAANGAHSKQNPTIMLVTSDGLRKATS